MGRRWHHHRIHRNTNQIERHGMNCGICGKYLIPGNYVYGACHDCAGKTIRAAMTNKSKHQPGCDGSGSHKNGCTNGPMRRK